MKFKWNRGLCRWPRKLPLLICEIGDCVVDHENYLCSFTTGNFIQSKTAKDFNTMQSLGLAALSSFHRHKGRKLWVTPKTKTSSCSFLLFTPYLKACSCACLFLPSKAVWWHRALLAVQLYILSDINFLWLVSYDLRSGSETH